MKTRKIKDFLPVQQNFKKLFRLLVLFSGPKSFLENLSNLTKLGRLPLVGENVNIKGKIRISDPEFIYLGSNVTVEQGANLEGRGGIVICDGATIKKNASLQTAQSSKTLQPIFIAQNQQVAANQSITPYSQLPTSNFQLPTPTKSPALAKGKNIFFILSTGRAGSTSIAAILNQHPDITCLHEPNRLLIRLSTEYAHGEKTKEQVREELLYYYTKTSIFPGLVYGESDHKLFNLVEILAEILPEAKFIWLIRSARKFVPSVYGRKWFQEDPTINERSVIEQDIHYYRIDGNQCGIFSEKEWHEMSVFEKVCWYWAFWNEKIESQLVALPNNRWYFVRLEELKAEVPGLLKFLEVSPMHLEIKQQNKANYKTLKPEQWDEEKQQAYDAWCVPKMKKWYPVNSQSVPQ